MYKIENNIQKILKLLDKNKKKIVECYLQMEVIKIKKLTVQEWLPIEKIYDDRLCKTEK